MTSRRRKKVRAFAVAVVITLVLGACVGDDSGGSQGTTKLANPTQTPAATGEAGTGSSETGPTVTGVENREPPPEVDPVLIGTVTRSGVGSGAGCALELDAWPIPPGAGRLSVVNEADRWMAFELYRLESEASFARFEAVVAEGDPLGQYPPGAFLFNQREVGPGDSGTITDNFTTGDAFAVVCLGRNAHHTSYELSFGEFVRLESLYRYRYLPFAVVGPIVVP